MDAYGPWIVIMGLAGLCLGLLIGIWTPQFHNRTVTTKVIIPQLIQSQSSVGQPLAELPCGPGLVRTYIRGVDVGCKKP